MLDPNAHPTIPELRLPYASRRRRRLRRTTAVAIAFALTFGAGAATALMLRPLFVGDDSRSDPRSDSLLSDAETETALSQDDLLAAGNADGAGETDGANDAADALSAAGPSEPELVEETVVLQRNDTFSAALTRAGVDDSQARALLAALRGQVDFRRVRPGHTLKLRRDAEGRVVSGAFETSPIDAVDFEATDDGFTASKRELDLVTTERAVSVTIQSSLWEAFLAADEDPSLAVLASDVLAWEIDFYRDVRRGDRLDLVVERITHDDQLVRYGKLLAVRYDGEMGKKELYRWEHGETNGWFDPDGRSARRPFLKQPLPLVRITSGFGGRRHPTLGYYKKHEGVDYGAPTGTPVWAVGDGVVTWADWKGANGKLVSIRHSNGYTSHYAHLSKIHVKKGQRVTQKQVIGRVGTTGRSTGPHLHFALARAGKFVNPLTVRFPAGDPLPAGQKDAFAAAMQPLAELLDSTGMVVAQQQ